MAYRIDSKKFIAFTGQGHCKHLTQEPKLFSVTTFYKEDLLSAPRPWSPLKSKDGLEIYSFSNFDSVYHHNFYFFFYRFEGLLVPKTKNITCNFMSVGEKRYKIRREKWNLLTPSELKDRFRKGKISSEAKHIGAGITFFIF